MPSLLDRLTTPDSADVMRGVQTVSQDSGGGSVSIAKYEDSVKRDLEWLFNASSPFPASKSQALAKKYPYVASSVLNFGLRGVFGRVVTDLREIENQVSFALSAFEPRLQVESQTIQVSEAGQVVEVQLEATLSTQWSSRHMVIRTDLENLHSTLSVDNYG